MNSKEEMLTR